MAKHHVTATVNGDAVEFLCETQETLLDVLRDQLGLTGTKEGCSTGDCGACSVTVDGRLVCSCLMLGVEANGKSVATIEGMAKGDELHPLQRKFIEQRNACGANIDCLVDAYTSQIMFLKNVRSNLGL